MISCFSIYQEIGPDPVAAFFGTILIFFIVGYFIFNIKSFNKRRVQTRQPSYYQTDVLGQEVPVYMDKSKSYKPMGNLNVRIAFFILIAVLASIYVSHYPQKVKPIEGISGSYYSSAAFNQATIQYYYKLFPDPVSPGKYYRVPYKGMLSNTDNTISFPIKNNPFSKYYLNSDFYGNQKTGLINKN